jgi:hypothetical protein
MKANGLLARVATSSQYTAFHATAFAATATGCSILVTAGDLGPWAPMLLALGFYAIFFGVFAEAAFWFRKFLLTLAGRLLLARARRGRST